MIKISLNWLFHHHTAKFINLKNSKMYKKNIKIILDSFLALFLLILLLPIMLSVFFLTYIFLGRPIIFKQKRPGLEGTIFDIYKFRTMTNEKDKNAELLSDVQRLGRFGKFMRSLSLDELPQLFNVLKGDMSFVGPRPLLVEYLPLYNKEQTKRHEVKPGITGWAQINGRNAISWEQKFEYDAWYVKNISFLLDLSILWKTFIKVVYRRDVNSLTSLTMKKFKGNKQ